MRTAFLCLLLAGCGGARYLDEAREANAQADALLAQGDPAGAARALEAFVARPAPAGLRATDRRALLQDAEARLAGLWLSAANPERALHFADAGLARGEGRDVFAAALHTLRGRANEALGRDGDAAKDYEAAQVIDEALLDAALHQGGDR
jgi:hypothetical protein